jgi:hypothetical protein
MKMFHGSFLPIMGRVVLLPPLPRLAAHTRMAHGCRSGGQGGCGHASTRRPCMRHPGRSAAVPHRTTPGRPRMPQDARTTHPLSGAAFAPWTHPGPRGVAKTGTPDMRLSLAPTGTRLAHPPRRARMPQDGREGTGTTPSTGAHPGRILSHVSGTDAASAASRAFQG